MLIIYRNGADSIFLRNKTVVSNAQYNIHQNVFDRDYDFTIPAGTKTVTLQVIEGDWLSLRSPTFIGPDGKPDVVQLSQDWSGAASSLN